jgi:hypothetical protein
MPEQRQSRTDAEQAPGTALVRSVPDLQAPVRSQIGKSQRVKLQTLWSQYARRSLDVITVGDRAARLAWASDVIQRPIASFNDLSRLEAARAISALNRALGMAAHQKRRKSREGAQAAGTHGRRGSDRKATEIVGPEDLARIQRALDRLGWDQRRFDAWLASPSSPIGRKTQIKTVADANRTWWALKGMLEAKGLWEE